MAACLELPAKLLPARGIARLQLRSAAAARVVVRAPHARPDFHGVRDAAQDAVKGIKLQQGASKPALYTLVITGALLSIIPLIALFLGLTIGQALQFNEQDGLCTPEGGTAAAQALIGEPTLVGIIGTFTALGIGVTAIFGASGIQCTIEIDMIDGALEKDSEILLYRIIQEPGFDELNTVKAGAPLALGVLGVMAFACATALREAPTYNRER